MIWTDDPVRDFERYDAEQEAWLRARPTCDACKNHIQEEYYYELEGIRRCGDCMQKFLDTECRNFIDE